MCFRHSLLNVLVCVPDWVCAPRYIPVWCISNFCKIGCVDKNSVFSDFCVLLSISFDLLRLIIIPSFEQSVMIDSIMAVSRSSEFEIIWRSSTNIIPATLVFNVCGARIPHCSSWMLVNMLLTYMMNRKGERTDPCYSPFFSWIGWVVSPPIL